VSRQTTTPREVAHPVGAIANLLLVLLLRLLLLTDASSDALRGIEPLLFGEARHFLAYGCVPVVAGPIHIAHGLYKGDRPHHLAQRRDWLGACFPSLRHSFAEFLK
jgi:hypothetical protein